MDRRSALVLLAVFGTGVFLAGLVETRRVGRETVCRLRPEAFGEVAARERAILGIAS